MTTNPISSAHTNNTNQTRPPAVPQQQAQQVTYPQDTFSLKSTGDADHDGDSK
jgi:hypothetical protein